MGISGSPPHSGRELGGASRPRVRRGRAQIDRLRLNGEVIAALLMLSTSRVSWRSISGSTERRGRQSSTGGEP